MANYFLNYFTFIVAMSKISIIFEYRKELTTILKNKIMTLTQANTKANELNTRFPNLKCEVITDWAGDLVIKVINSDKAKTLNEMFRGYNFTF